MESRNPFPRSAARSRLFPILLALSLTLPAFVAAQSDERRPSRIHVVETGPFVPSCEVEGRVDSVTRVRVGLSPTEYTGPLQVLTVTKREGVVKKGEPLLAIDTSRLDLVLESTRRSLATGEDRVELLREQLKILQETNATALERAQRELQSAQSSFDSFDKHEAPQMIRAAGLTVEQRTTNLVRRKEELRELEESFADTDVAEEKREIVLERARSGVRMAETLLELAQSEEVVVKDFRVPDRRKKLQDRLKWAEQGVARTGRKNSVTASLKQEEVREAENTAEELTARIARLESDRAACAVLAPESGTLAPITLRTGDSVLPRVAISQIYDPNLLVVTADAPAESLRILANGKPVTLHPVAYRDITCKGSVTAIGDLGTPLADTTVFVATVTVEQSHPLLRIGLRCLIRAAGETITNTIAIPREAIEGTREPSVRVWKNGAEERREVVLGARNRESVQILEGLAPGDEVILPRNP